MSPEKKFYTCTLFICDRSATCKDKVDPVGTIPRSQLKPICPIQLSFSSKNSANFEFFKNEADGTVVMRIYSWMRRYNLIVSVFFIKTVQLVLSGGMYFKGNGPNSAKRSHSLQEFMSSSAAKACAQHGATALKTIWPSTLCIIISFNQPHIKKTSRLQDWPKLL